MKVAARPIGCEKLVRVLGRVAVKAFLVKHHRNSQPAVLDEKFLDRVGQFRSRRASNPSAGIAGRGADLAETVALFETGPGLL